MKRLLLLALIMPALALGQAPSEPEKKEPPKLGILGAVGVPDGVVASAVYRPVEMLRLSAGGTWNYFGFGVQGGVGCKPLQWPIAPTVDLDVGHYFDADMRWVADQGAGFPPELKPLLEKVGYNYANLHVGIEIGSSRSLVLFARAGLSYFWTTIRGVQTLTDSSGATVRVEDPRLRATLPSVKLGILFFL
jgi:hypothetical protein